MESYSREHCISVIICTYNRYLSLKDTLESLINQQTNNEFDYEVLVVDNNSTDKTKETVNSYSARFPFKITYLFESRQGLSNARNKGIQEARGSIIAFTDDDCIADHFWLYNLYEIFKESDTDAVGGRVLPLYAPSTPLWIKMNHDLLTGPIVYHDYGDLTIEYDRNKTTYFVGANMAFRKRCFLNDVLFRTDLGVGQGTKGEESEFHRRLKNENRIVYYCGKAIVWHKISRQRATLKYLAQWYIDAGKTEVRCDPKKEHNLVFYFNIPRYIYRGIVQYTILLVLNLYNPRKFLINFQKIFTYIGRIIEYRKCCTFERNS